MCTHRGGLSAMSTGGNPTVVASSAGTGSAVSAAAQAYLAKIGNDPSKVKYERVKSLNREDGVFLDDNALHDNIKQAAFARNLGNITGIRFVSVPDSSGNADVEVTYTQPTRRLYTGGVDMGSGARSYRTIGGGTFRQQFRIKIMNT